MTSEADWMKRDLWSKHDLTRLCLGFLPDAPVDWNEALQIRSNEIEQRIDEAVLAKKLACIEPTDTQDGPHNLYGRNRYFRPAEASPWASRNFPDFVFSRDKISNEKPLHPRAETTYLNTIAALLSLLLLCDGELGTQAAVIEKLLDDYPDADGISKSKLEQTFAKAKREFDLNWPSHLK